MLTKDWRALCDYHRLSHPTPCCPAYPSAPLPPTHTDTHSSQRTWVLIWQKGCPSFIFISGDTRNLEFRTRCCRAHLFEVAIFPLFPIHHVVENRDHDVSDLGLRHQGDAEEGAHHSWDEVGLVVTWIYTDQHRLGHTALADLIKKTKCTRAVWRT